MQPAHDHSHGMTSFADCAQIGSGAGAWTVRLERVRPINLAHVCLQTYPTRFATAASVFAPKLPPDSAQGRRRNGPVPHHRARPVISSVFVGSSGAQQVSRTSSSGRPCHCPGAPAGAAALFSHPACFLPAEPPATGGSLIQPSALMAAQMVTASRPARQVR